jgi:BirA family transcriptional regulator, biotin operon repressor / biotin---[acetyl-CoA-carboxylase] ligase
LTSISELTFFGTPVVFFSEIESTNDYLKKLDTTSPQLVITDNQYKGRGQYGRVWESECSQNLCFSFLYFPNNLAIDQGFKVSQCIALALVESLNKFIGPEKAFIKWPNDIILKDKKVCGLLIESVSSHSEIQKIIGGIGLNVNQEMFSSTIANAGSLKSLTNSGTIDRVDLLKNIITHLEQRLQKGFGQNMEVEYNNNLYKLKQEIILAKDGVESKYINLGINEHGHWLVRNVANDSIEEIVSSREMEYVFS